MQAPGCTTAYKVVNIYDDFDVENGEDDTVDWSVMGFWDITLQFNLKKNVFVDPEAGVIPANGKYVMYFNSADRRWYTKDRF